MPRKPNYRFDRHEKDRAKAAKRAERLKVKQERSGKKQTPGSAEPELDSAEPQSDPGEGSDI